MSDNLEERGEEENQQQSHIYNDSARAEGDCYYECEHDQRAEQRVQDECADEQCKVERDASIFNKNDLPKVLSKAEEKRQLSKHEIAYGISYFTTNYGYNNPYNVLTPQLLRTRFQSIQDLSYNSCVQMLREPFGQKKSQNKLLTPQDVLEILDYRSSEADTLDFAEESFLMLGAKDLNDKISIRQLAKDVEVCYANLEKELAISDDYHQHCNVVHQELQYAERLRAEREQTSEQKIPPMKIDTQVAGLEAIIAVLRQAIDTEEIGIEEWKQLFSRVNKLQFADYAQEIRRGK